MKVIGIQKNVSFQYNGQTFTGTNLYTGDQKEGVEGIVSQKFFFNSSKECHKVIDTLKVGDEVRIYFNQYGKPDGVQKI